MQSTGKLNCSKKFSLICIAVIGAFGFVEDL